MVKIVPDESYRPMIVFCFIMDLFNDVIFQPAYQYKPKLIRSVFLDLIDADLLGVVHAMNIASDEGQPFGVREEGSRGG